MKDYKSSNFKNAAQPRSKRRYFSESARKAIVLEIDNGLSKAEAARKYEVTESSIYKWIRMYSKDYTPTLTTRVEHQSDSQKNKILEAELSKVYEALGRAQTENMLLNKVLELAGEHFETDLKKTFENRHLPVSITKKKASK